MQKWTPKCKVVISHKNSIDKTSDNSEMDLYKIRTFRLASKLKKVPIMIKVLKIRKILWYTTWEEELHNNHQPIVETPM